jgi:hypothetical protein
MLLWFAGAKLNPGAGIAKPGFAYYLGSGGYVGNGYCHGERSRTAIINSRFNMPFDYAQGDRRTKSNSNKNTIENFTVFFLYL